MGLQQHARLSNFLLNNRTVKKVCAQSGDLTQLPKSHAVLYKLITTTIVATNKIYKSNALILKIMKREPIKLQ